MASGIEYKKPAFTIGQKAFITKAARASVINGRVLNNSFNTDICTKKLFAQLFQSAIGTQFFHRPADFRQRFIVAFVYNKTGTDFSSAGAVQATCRPELGFFFR